jgi:hypothetical protein
MAGILRVYRSPSGWRPRLATLGRSWSSQSSQSSAQVGKIRRHESCQRDRFVCAVHVVAARVRLRFLRVGL